MLPCPLCCRCLSLLAGRLPRGVAPARGRRRLCFARVPALLSAVAWGCMHFSRRWMVPERGHPRGVSTARAFLACLRLPSPISCNIYVPLAMRAHGFSCSRRFRRGHMHGMCMRGQCTIQFSISAFGSSRHKHCQLEGPFTGRTSAIGARLGKAYVQRGRCIALPSCTSFTKVITGCIGSYWKVISLLARILGL